MSNKIKNFKFIVIFLIFIALAFAYKRYSDLHNDQNIFEEIYKANYWGEGSAPVSKTENTQPYLDLLQTYLNDDKFQTIVDLGCGDWQIMKTITIPSNKKYRGYDVVKSVVEENITKHSKENVKFFHISKLNDFFFEKGDLLIVKDVLQHWSSEQVIFFIKKILPNFKYALITNGFDKNLVNGSIETGGFRFIDLEKTPFDIHKNVKVLTDYSSRGNIKRVYLYTNPLNK